jgi:hypothetical protein
VGRRAHDRELERCCAAKGCAAAVRSAQLAEVLRESARRAASAG